jgi:Family of unknown function (DUF6518)
LTAPIAEIRSQNTSRTLVLGGIAAALGGAAFIGDQLGGVMGTLFAAATNSGFLWALGAFLVGYSQFRPSRAAIVGALFASASTITYYLLVAFVSRPWSGGVLENGQSATAAGLASLGRATLFWLVLSVGVGAILGALGSAIRSNRIEIRAIAAGGSAGLLGSQGLYTLLTIPVWRLPRAESRISYYVFVATLIIGLVVPILLLTRSAAPRRWSIFVLSCIVGAVAAVGVWAVLQAVRVSSL